MRASRDWWLRLGYLIYVAGMDYNSAKASLRQANAAARAIRMPDEICGARRKRDGKPCLIRALDSGRCRWHGGITHAMKVHADQVRQAIESKEKEKEENNAADPGLTPPTPPASGDEV